MSDLPVSWASAELGEITTISPKFNAGDVKDEHLVHFVPMAATDEEFGGVDVSQLRPLREVRKGYTSFVEGDVLFAKITPCMENGKGGLVPRLPHKHAFGSTEFHVLRPSEAITSLWLAHFLSQAEFRKIARRNMTGTAGQLRVPTKWLETVCLPVPPLSEQTRIVEKLEELLGGLDVAIGELKAAQCKLTHYRQSLLKAAMEGVLTAQWRAARAASSASFPRKRESSAFAVPRLKPLDSRFRGNDGIEETGADLLHRILQERRARWEAKQLAKFAQTGKTPPKGWQAKYPEPVVPDTTDLPALPEGWVWVSVEQVVSDEPYALAIGPFGSNLVVSDYRSKGVPLIFVRNIRSKTYGGEAAKFVTAKKAEELKAHHVAPGDVLVTKMGDPPGDADVYPDGQPIAVITADCIKIRPQKELIDAHYLTAVINSPLGIRQIKPMTQGVAQKKVSLGRFSSFAVPLPPRAEQAEIMSVLGTALSAFKEQEAAITHSLHQAAAQRRNLLRAAFSGQLVPQDPADEPASELLARIRAVRASQVSSHSGRSKAARVKRIPPC